MVAAVEEVAVGVEVVRPGACALAARGPSRYFGGEEAAAERIVEQIAEACAVESQVGIADGVFAAGLAARAGRVVAPGESREFLAGVSIEALERPELTDLLKRLGITTLGDFAALPPADVLTRFGFDGALAHRLACGDDLRPLAVRQPPPDLDVTDTYDEPLERVDVAAFAGRVLAERLHDRLAAHGLACTRLGIEAVTADGQELHRVWRHDGTLTAVAIAERVRWQLDGWLTGGRRGAPARPTAGLVRLRLIPDGVLVHLGLQPGLWGDAGAGRERAHRAFSRVQGLLGPEALATPVTGGGRSVDDRIRLVPWGDERDPTRQASPLDDPIPDFAITAVLSRAVSPPPAPAVGDEPADSATVIPLHGRRGSASPEAVHLPATDPAAEASVLEFTGPGPGPGPGPGAGPGAEAGAGTAAGAVDELGSSTAAGTDAGGVVMVAVRPGPKRRNGPRVRREVALPPWPGRLPRPSPAMVLPQPMSGVLLDAVGVPVGVSARLELTGNPAALIVDRGQPVEIDGWAGPWAVDERWWAPGEARRRARFQVRLADGRALLVALGGGYWAVEAVYD